MSKKQWIWLCVAIVLFAGCGALSVVMNTWHYDTVYSTTTAADLFGETEVLAEEFPMEHFIARIDVEGTIMDMDDTFSYGATGYFDPADTIDYIDRLIDCPNNAGLLLYIDSGGGEMGATDELYLKLMDYKTITGRPIYAYFDGYACSGAYYLAMAADEIWANRNCICVNIGVYISTYNFSQLFDNLGVEQVIIRSSDNKGIGMTGVPWTEEQLAIYQSIVDLYYDQFLEVVALGRGMTKAEVMALDDGREMLAAQALEAGFIDGIGRYEEYEEQVLGEQAGWVTIYERPQETDAITAFFEYFYSRAEALVPESDGELLKDFVSRQDGIVVMAYAG